MRVLVQNDEMDLRLDLGVFSREKDARSAYNSRHMNFEFI